MKKYTITVLGLVAMASPASLQAQTVIGTDDFDGGGNFISRVFSPDNSGNTGFGGAPGVFPTSNFDVFGITNRGVGDDFADESVVGIGDPREDAADDFGIYSFSKADSFFGMVDTINDDNSAPVTVIWQFDVSGYENLQVGFDAAAVGNFEANDTYNFFASFDGNATQPEQVVTSSVADDVTYTITMDNGMVYDRYLSPFFSESTWDDLIANGPSGDLTYSEFDVDQNGFDDATGERTYDDSPTFGPDVERELFVDPVVLNGVQLGDDPTAITGDITGTGDTLTLTFVGSSDGSFEQFVFDDLVITGDLIGVNETLAGDFNDDDLVGSADLGLVLSFWGALVAAGESPDSTWVNADDVTGPNIGSDELGLVLANWGNTAEIEASLASISSVTGFSETQILALIPEPTSLMLMGVASLGLIARRRHA